MKSSNILYRSFYDHPMVLLRIWLGIAFINHGLPGIFSNDFMDGHAAMVDLFNIPLPVFAAYASKGGELLSGILLLFGLFTRVGALVVILNMTIVTIFALQGQVFSDFQTEISFTYLIMGIAIFLKGTTPFSIDRMLMKQESTTPN